MNFIHYFQMYHTLTNGAREWLLMEMRKLVRELEKTFQLEISEENFRRAIQVYNRTRRLMARLNEFRKTDPPALSGSEYMQIVLTGMSIPREKFNDRLEILLSQIDGRRSGEAGQPRLLIMGGGFDSFKFIDFLESKGASIVADGLCFGLRHYQGLIDEQTNDPLEAIADRYLCRVPCPSIIDGFDQGYVELQKIMHDWNVQGVICARLKFCDHWAGARKMLKDAMQKDKGLPVLDLEREYSTTGSGQISTRMQAFLEMLPKN
jgi:benzoyl-CoA reductase/2-hydroxyglutaryl-CoA dehydratase subunit BcrC/BadD/HgdB